MTADNSDLEEYSGLIVGQVVPARYSSKCGACSGRISADDQIALVWIENDPQPLGFGCPRCLAGIKAARRAEMLGRTTDISGD